jgi:hypothetical protein
VGGAHLWPTGAPSRTTYLRSSSQEVFDVHDG